MRISVLAVLMSALAVPAGATLLNGLTVNTTYLFPSTAQIFAGPVNSTVGPGTELINFAGFVNIDFSDTNILITTTRGGGPNLVAFDGLRFMFAAIPAFGSVTLDPSTTYTGFTASRLSSVGSTIFVNVASPTGAGLLGQTISIDLAPSSSVPEPGSFALIAGALALLGRRIAVACSVRR